MLLAQKFCILGLWLLQNTNKKTHAGSWANWTATADEESRTLVKGGVLFPTCALILTVGGGGKHTWPVKTLFHQSTEEVKEESWETVWPWFPWKNDHYTEVPAVVMVAVVVAVIKIMHISILVLLWHCWLGVRKSIRPVKVEWWSVGVVIYLEQGADSLHIVLPLYPKTLSSLASFKSRLVLSFRYRLTLVFLQKKPLNGCSSSSSSILQECCN